MKIIEFRPKKDRSADREEIFSGRMFEKCVVCGATTDVPVRMNVSERKCYVPGSGQLCSECCMKIYGTDDLRFLF